MIRGAVYRVDLSGVWGREQHGRRYGIVVSPSGSPLSVCTIIPKSTTAQHSLTRPMLEVAGRETRVLVDQIRTIDVDYVHGDPVDYIPRDAMAQIEHTMAHYLGIVPDLLQN